MSAEATAIPEKTYEAGCHCGYIKFSVTLRPPLDQEEPFDCGCSICRRNGYLLVYPLKTDVHFHGESRQRCSEYRFNSKTRSHIFCPQCGSSLGIDFDQRTSISNKYGINVRSFNEIDIGGLNIEKGNGLVNVKPARDLSGTTYTEPDAGEAQPRNE